MATEYDDRQVTGGRSGGATACLLVGLLLLVLVGAAAIGAGFFFYQARQRAMMRAEAIRAEMEARMIAEEARVRAEHERHKREEEIRAAEEAERRALLEARRREGVDVTVEVEGSVPRNSPAKPRGAAPATLVRVEQGDALVLTIDGVQTPVRLVGVSSPAPGAPGHQGALDALKALCGEQMLHVAPDPEVDRKDDKGRLLYWVWAGDRLLNLEMLRQGHAKLAQQYGLGRYEKELRAAVK